MSKAKKLIREYLHDGIKPGKRPAVAQRTVFTRQPDGAVVRRVVRADGTVEHKQRIPAKQWEIFAARAETGLRKSSLPTCSVSPSVRFRNGNRAASSLLGRRAYCSRSLPGDRMCCANTPHNGATHSLRSHQGPDYLPRPLSRT